jgi:hypothetical protein
MKITKRQLRRIIKEEKLKIQESGYGYTGNSPRGHVSYEKMVQAINDNIEEALRHDAIAKVIYDVMLEGGWIE